MARIVSYKFRETDQTVYISGSGGTSASIAADVDAIKLPNASFNPNYNLNIGSDIFNNSTRVQLKNL